MWSVIFACPGNCSTYRYLDFVWPIFVTAQSQTSLGPGHNIGACTGAGKSGTGVATGVGAVVGMAGGDAGTSVGAGIGVDDASVGVRAGGVVVASLVLQEQTIPPKAHCNKWVIRILTATP